MGLLAFLRKAFGDRGGGYVRPVTVRHPDGWHGSSENHAREPVTAESVLGLSAAWACANLLCGTIGSLPLMVFLTGRDGARTVAREHPLYRVLHDSPNADQTAVDFWELMTLSIELWGNAYAVVVRSGPRVIALEPVRPDIVTVRRREGGELVYEWTENGRRNEIGQDGMLHIRGFGGGPLGGLSTLSYGRHTFGLAHATDRAAGATFANGLRPSGQIVFKEWLTTEQRGQAKQVVADFQGAMNAGKPWIGEGGMEWKPLTINPEDAQMLESRGFSVEEVCRLFGVPPFMIGHTKNSTSWGTGLEQQTLGFQKFTLRRRLKRIEQALEKQLLTPADRAAGVVIEFNLEGLLRGDSASRAAFYTAMLNAGVFTINEVRATENRPPVEGGDVPRMQMQNVPITEAGKVSLVAPPRSEAA
jgi:HK97 family phage portal protein